MKSIDADERVREVMRERPLYAGLWDSMEGASKVWEEDEEDNVEEDEEEADTVEEEEEDEEGSMVYLACSS